MGQSGSPSRAQSRSPSKASALASRGRLQQQDNAQLPAFVHWSTMEELRMIRAQQAGEKQGDSPEDFPRERPLSRKPSKESASVLQEAAGSLPSGLAEDCRMSKEQREKVLAIWRAERQKFIAA